MAAGKTKSIYEIDDIAEMYQAMAALGISCKGLKTLDDMKSRVRDELHVGQSEKAPMWSAGQAFSILSRAIDYDSRKKQVLLNLYNETEKFLDKTDPKLLTLLQQSVGNFKEKMRHHKVQLEQKEYYLLVAGETGSGKSSLVNLILGKEVLPYSVLGTGSTICELKFGEERRMVVHFKDKDPLTGLTKRAIRLMECRTDSAEQAYLQQISPFVHTKSERKKGSIFKKIELFWPHSLLWGGIVIIESPGIGEPDIMDEIVTQYLPQAFAFIYTINSANVRGFEKLLEEVKKISLDKQGGFPSKCALFVCNKWDQVPGREVQEVKHHVIRKLQSCWPGLDPETQIIYISTMKASTAQNHGFITDDFSYLMNGLRCMVLKSIGARLQFHWKWLDSLLSRTIYQAKAFVMNASRNPDKVAEKMALIVLRLLNIEEEQNKMIEDLQQHLKSGVDGALQKLSKYLSSENVKARFKSWTIDEVPKAEDSWEATRNQITKVLSNRLREIIEEWEKDNKVFGNARESLVQHFQNRFNFIVGQLRNLQGAITDDILDVPESQPPETDLTMAEKIIIGVTSPIWVPLYLVALVIGVPVVGIMAIKSKLEDRRKKKKYEDDKCAFMTEISIEYLEAAKEESVLKAFVNDQMKEAKVCLKQIEARLPELIEANKILCQQLRDETRSRKDIKQIYQPIMDKGSSLRAHLAVFGITEVRATDISSEDLDWKENTSSRLGCGAFGVVYQGAMRRNGVVHSVALKVFNEVLDATNSILIMAEVEILRKLDHPCIVKFYGTSLIEERNTVRMILVMEKCKGNLKNHIFGHPELAPGKSRNPDVVRKVCQWVKQITAALTYIHEQGIVHRDLKLDNILLSEENSVKVTDVGVSKPAVDITGTIAGTPAYLAPEVFHSQVYDCKADIYSLGIMLWEIWYGEQAFANVKVQTLADLFCLVDEGYRPEDVKGCNRPPPNWQTLMNQCWNENPQKRPTARKCYNSVHI